MTCLLQRNLVILSCKTSDPTLYLLGLGIILQKFVSVEAWGNRLHPQVNTGVLFLCALLLFFPKRRRCCQRALLINVIVNWEGRVMSEWSDFFKFMEELFVWLSNFLVLLIVAMCEGSTFVLSIVFLLGNSGWVKGELIFTVFSDSLKFANVCLIESEWRVKYNFCW